jgi:hypothetical protein
MNRIIPIAGALAAALGSMLTLAPAKAATCTFGVPTATCVAGWSTILGDKTFTIVTAPDTGSGILDWSVEALAWKVETIWDDNDLLGAAQGSFSYIAEITSGSANFYNIGLSSEGFEGPQSAGDNVVTKTIAADAQGNTVLATLTSTNGGDSNVVLPSGYTKLYITDQWDVPAGNELNGIVNYHTQRVPGPLPVLGAVAALGFSRRMRRSLSEVNV